MRIFHAKIMDHYLEGSAVLSSLGWAYLLSRAEILKFICIASGTSSSFSLVLLGAATGFANSLETTKLLIDQVPVSGTQTFQVSYSQADVTNPPPRLLFVEAFASGTNPHVHAQVWVCGRGPQKLEDIPATAPSFRAQLAAAKMLEDEDRLPSKKRALPQGSSLFYPPELFVPSLKWER